MSGLLGQRTMKTVRLILSIALLIMLALVLARLTWLILTPESIVRAEAGQADAPEVDFSSADETEDLDVFDIGILMDFNPFGGTVDGPGEQELAPIPEDVRESDLDIEYKGGRSDENGTGVAYLDVPGVDQQAFAEGDELINGYTVYRIEPLRLIIEKDGEKEAILKGGGPVIGGLVPQFNDDIQAIGGGSQSSSSEEDDDDDVDEEEFLEERERRRSAPPQPGGDYTVQASDILQNAALSRVRQRGLSIGIGIVPRGDAGILERVGFVRNDVIIAVNGVSYQNINDAELLEEITEGGVLSLTVRRDGFDEPVTVNLTIEKESE